MPINKKLGIFLCVASGAKENIFLDLQTNKTYKLLSDYKKYIQIFSYFGGIGIRKNLDSCQWDMTGLPLELTFCPFKFHDGKFDLSQYNQNWFDIQKQTITIDSSFGMKTQLSILDWCGLMDNFCGQYNPWKNNHQNFWSFEQTEAWPYVEAYIRKIWAELGGFENVIFEPVNEYRGGLEFIIKLFRLFKQLKIPANRLTMGADICDDQIIAKRLVGEQESQTGYMLPELIKPKIEEIYGDNDTLLIQREIHGCLPGNNHTKFFTYSWSQYKIFCRLSTDGIQEKLSPEQLKQLVIEIFSSTKTPLPWNEPISHVVEFCPTTTDIEYLKSVVSAMADGYKEVYGHYPENYHKYPEIPEEKPEITIEFSADKTEITQWERIILNWKIDWKPKDLLKPIITSNFMSFSENYNDTVTFPNELPIHEIGNHIYWIEASIGDVRVRKELTIIVKPKPDKRHHPWCHLKTWNFKAFFKCLFGKCPDGEK